MLSGVELWVYAGGAVAEWVTALACTGDRTILAGFESHCGKTSLRNFVNSVYPALPVSFGGDTKSRRSLLSAGCLWIGDCSMLWRLGGFGAVVFGNTAELGARGFPWGNSIWWNLKNNCLWTTDCYLWGHKYYCMCIYKCFNNMYVLLYHYMVAPMLATCYMS